MVWPWSGLQQRLNPSELARRSTDTQNSPNPAGQGSCEWGSVARAGATDRLGYEAPMGDRPSP
ncbi:MAG TPA: hypothetical protein V6D46_02140, partial [Coleofasciculaceae cyanobacterium]